MSRCKSTVMVGATLRRCRWGEGHKANAETVFAYHASQPVTGEGGKYGVAWTDDQVANVTPEPLTSTKKKLKLGFNPNEVVLAYPISDPRPVQWPVLKAEP